MVSDSGASMLNEKPAFSPKERIERRPPGYSASRRSPQFVISCRPSGYKKKGRRCRLKSNVAFPPRSSAAVRSHLLPTMPCGHIVSDTKSTCTATGVAAATVDNRVVIKGWNRSVEVRVGREAQRSIASRQAGRKEELRAKRRQSLHTRETDESFLKMGSSPLSACSSQVQVLQVCVDVCVRPVVLTF